MKNILLTMALLTTSATAQNPIYVTAATATQIPAAPVTLPDVPELKQKVTVAVPMGGLSLENALTIIARSVGLTALTQGLPTVQLRSGLNNIPAREAIATLLNLYAPGSSATVKGKLLVIGDASAINRLTALPSDTPQRDLVTVNVEGLNAEQFSRIQPLLQGQSLLFDTGRVILSGTTEQIKHNQTVLSKLKVSSTATDETSVITYPIQVDPAQAANTVQTLTGVSASVIGKTLVVKGTSRQQKAVSQLISALNASAPATQNTNAANTPQTVKRSYEAINPQTEKLLIEALLDGVKVTPLDAQRLIIVDATEVQHKAVGTILDTQKMRVNQLSISYYPVNTGKASDLVPALRRELPGSDIQVVEGRNIISVQANQANQLRVAQILSKLQAAPEVSNENALITRSIKLGYSDAEALAASLNSLKLTSASQDIGSQSAPSSGTTQPVSIFVDKRTNSLLLSGPRNQVDEMTRAIASIDVPEKTVRVRLRVEQVNLTDISNLGIDWNIGFAGVTVGQKSGNLSIGYAPTNVANVGLNFNTAKTNGNNKTIIDSNFAALSGQPTNFSSGGELLFPATTTVVGNTPVNNPGQTYKYGLNIKVTPRIAPDGTIVMTMDTDLGSTPATGPQSSIQQSKQTMTSTVMLKQGETVVLGGIMTNTLDNSKVGVKGLMDVPVLGALFGTKTNTSTNTALLFLVSAEEVKPTISTTGSNGTERIPVSPAGSAMSPVAPTPAANKDGQP